MIKKVNYLELCELGQFQVIYNILDDKIPNTDEFFSNNTVLNRKFEDYLKDKYGITSERVSYQLDPYYDYTSGPIRVSFHTKNFLTPKIQHYFRRKYQKAAQLPKLLIFNKLTELPLLISLGQDTDPSEHTIHSFGKTRNAVVEAIVEELKLPYYTVLRLYTEIEYELEKKYLAICEELYELGKTYVDKEVFKILRKIRNKEFDEQQF